MKVFFAVSESDAEEVSACGMKVSRYATRNVSIDGVEHRCIVAALTPGDIVNASDSGIEVLRLNPDDLHGWIAEGVFYEEYGCADVNGEDRNFWMSEYEKSIIPAAEYKLGMYKKPEYLIYRTLFPESIERFDRRRGEPILYDNSNELYMGKAMSFAEENCDDFYELALKAFADRWAAGNGFSVRNGGKYTIYMDENGNVKYISASV